MARGNDAACLLLGQALDLAKTETERVRAQDIVRHLAMTRMRARCRMVLPLERGIPIRVIDVDCAHLDPVLSDVAHDLRGRIEAHRLCVEQGGCEDVRIPAFEPGRGVDQERKARRMAFRKAVFAEALDLTE